MTWIQLTPKQAQSFYGIPAEIASAPENTFFGMPIDLPYAYDDLRPFIAFLQRKERPDVVTLYIKTIHPEGWEDDKGVLFNPLSVTVGGYLSLEKERLIGLTTILSSYQNQLSFTFSQRRQMFEEIEDSNLKEYHLHPEWFPKTKQEYYLQVYDPLADPDTNSVVTILNFSKTAGFSTVHFAITQFPSARLQDPNFQPLDRGQSRINLDSNGLQELAKLLREQASYLDNAE